MSAEPQLEARPVTPPPPMVRLHVRTAVFAVPVLIGAPAYLALSAKGSRAAWSYSAGVGLTAVLLIGGVMAVRAAAVLSPALATLMAMTTYGTVSLVLAATLALSDPHVLDAPAFALGLVIGAVVGVAVQIRDARPPRERDDGPALPVPGGPPRDGR